MSDAQASVEIPTTGVNQLSQRYIALWNEPDPDRRRQIIESVWTEDGIHILQPPEEIRQVAARPGIGLRAILEARGYAELEARAGTAYEEWVGSQGLSFRRRDDVERLGDVVKFHWEAVDGDDAVFAVGLTFLLLAADGRVRRDYTFVVG